ncbi:nuclease Le1 [Dacryopinax primogenitus]|uniref:Nuclease Le1 n=1 Tax=Dacryopinax primogenitus (strain DJM 731) TaxID=1858805 RepID=M5G9S5_DACPD|nr:nuclease Le1 [Dacryopinax primogenitus]EJU05564.1 nuclease Le1 [Dacryopinax primogenitus]
MLAVSFLLTFSVLPRVLAWGNDGHETVGYIAQAFLTSGAASFVSEYLDSSYNGQLGPAATWADSVRYGTAYEWSQPYHFVDAMDSPLTGSCSVEETRDRDSEGCILTAIANYTKRITDTSLSKTQRDEALKFLTHFLGDVTQPLHCENYEYGGNDIDVTFNGDSDDLHSVWYTGIIELNLKTTYDNSVTTYANSLISRIKSGDLTSEAPSWITCVNPTEKLSSRASIDSLECPIEWARDSNAYDCSFVFTYTKRSDLAETSYYTDAIPIIDVQLAKGGYRLAAWLHTIFDGSTGLPS